MALTTYIILDTSSLLRITGVSSLSEFFGNSFYETKFVTTPSVVEEMRRTSSMLHFEIFRDELSIIQPEEKYIRKVKEKSRQFGGNILLSKTDIELLALAIQLSNFGKIVIVSEDKDVQNLASFLGFEIYSVTGNKIRKIYKLVKRCLSCGNVYDFNFTTCPDCGSDEFRIERRRKSWRN